MTQPKIAELPRSVRLSFYAQFERFQDTCLFGLSLTPGLKPPRPQSVCLNGRLYQFVATGAVFPSRKVSRQFFSLILTLASR